MALELNPEEEEQPITDEQLRALMPSREDLSRFGQGAANADSALADRPTLGQRIAAKATPAPVLPKEADPAPPDVKPTFDPKLMPSGVLAGITTQVPQPESAPDAHSVMRMDPSNLPDALRTAALTPSQVPPPPTGAQNPNRMGWMQKQAEDMKPLDRNAVDPKTGKPMYRMRWGQRLLGTLANFGNGFARDGAAPIYVGPGATNWKFGRDEATREANVARDTTALGEEEKLDTTNQKMYEDAKERRAQNV